LITLYLVEKGLLSKPTLYLSDFFERNKGSYYDSLTVVQTSNNIEQWIKFFLTGVAETAKKGKMTFEQIILLRQNAESRILSLGRRGKEGHRLLRLLFSDPIVTAKKAGEYLNLTHPAVNRLLENFREKGILTELTGFRRNRVFAFIGYLDLFSK